MLNTPFPPWPSFTDEEANAVQQVLLSNKVNYWTGTECREFEKEFAAWCGTRHAVALSNGTLALDVALKALGVGAGDEVVVTPRTFIALFLFAFMLNADTLRYQFAYDDVLRATKTGALGPLGMWAPGAFARTKS